MTNPYPDLYTDVEWAEIDKLEAIRPGMGMEMQVKNLCRELGPAESLRRLRRAGDGGIRTANDTHFWFPLDASEWTDASPESLAWLALEIGRSNGRQT